MNRGATAAYSGMPGTMFSRKVSPSDSPKHTPGCTTPMAWRSTDGTARQDKLTASRHQQGATAGRQARAQHQAHGS